MADVTDGQSGMLRFGQAVLLIFAAIVGASVVVQTATDALVAAGVFTPESIGLTVVSTVLQFSAFVAVVGIYLGSSGDTELLSASIPNRRSLLLAVGSVLGLLAGQYLLVELFALFGLEPGQNRVIVSGRGADYYLAMTVLSILVVGPVEELLFRGAVQGLLRRAWGAATAIGVTSLLFGFVHYISVTGPVEGRLVYVAIAALLGIVLGTLYERTDNLAIPALAHGGYNAVLFAIQYLAAIGVVG